MRRLKKLSSLYYGKHPIQVKHKQNWGQGFIHLLPQATVHPGSDAGSDGVEPTSDFVI